MAHRAVKVISIRPNIECIVSFNSEFREYRARLYVCGIAENAADYFCDDKQDAIQTAQAMAEHKHAAMKAAELNDIRAFKQEYSHA